MTVVVVIDGAERLEDPPTLGGNTGNHIHDVPARVGQSVPDDDRQRLREIARERIAHLDGWAEIGRPLGENPCEILARMTADGDEERDAMAVPRRRDLDG